MGREKKEEKKAWCKNWSWIEFVFFSGNNPFRGRFGVGACLEAFFGSDGNMYLRQVSFVNVSRFQFRIFLIFVCVRARARARACA